MKRMMLLASAVMTAGLLQAAALNWQSGAFTSGFAGPSGQNLANSTAYTATLLVWQDAAGTIPFVAGTGTQIIDDTASATGAFSGTSANNFPGGATSGFYAQMYIISDDGMWERTSQIRQLTTIPTTGNLSVNFATGQGFVGSTGGGSLWSGPAAAWQPIPEPTSLALLGIGAAVAGLRRKLRRK
jgi:hypothetical protein